MSLLSQVNNTMSIDPPIITIYGKSGSRKTQFGIDMPDPIFALFENGLGNRKVNAIDLKSVKDTHPYEAFKMLIKDLATEQHDYKTLVIDSADHLTPYIDDFICKRDGKVSIEAYGYGKGYDAQANEWLLIMNRLVKLRTLRKMNIVIIAHAGERQVSDPTQMDTYSVWEPKLPKKACAIVKELSDILAYICPLLNVVENESGKTKAIGKGEYVLKFNPNPAYEAKNRYQLDDGIPVSATEFMNAWQSKCSGK